METELIERLVRVETKFDMFNSKLDDLNKKMDTHLDRHYQFNIKSLFALASAGVALVISLFK